MLVMQSKYSNGKTIEMKSIEWNRKTFYSVELRQIAPDNSYPWEIHKDGTRTIMRVDFISSREKAEQIFHEYMKKAGE